MEVARGDDFISFKLKAFSSSALSNRSPAPKQFIDTREKSNFKVEFSSHPNIPNL